MRRAEYRITSETPGAFRAQNRAQGLDVEFSPGRVAVRARPQQVEGRGGGDWSWALRLEGFGREGQLRSVGDASAEANGNRVEFRREDITEWYVNDSRGIEQGFTIQERPEGDGTLRVELAVEGDLVPAAKGNQGVSFSGGNGRAVLSYDKLCVIDADGRELPARFDVASASIAIHVDDSGAAYPVIIDPVVSQVAKLTASDGAADDFFGRVSVSGDTVVVGADEDDDKGDGSGSAYVFERNAGGADNWGQVAKLTASDGAASDGFGGSVSISGDTVLVGAWWAEVGGNLAQGAAYVYGRNVGGVDNWGQVKKLAASDGAMADFFGCSVSVSGDTAVVGALGDDIGAIGQQGSAYIFERNQGGPNNWGEVAKLTASDGAETDCFGQSVSISGDTVLVGAWWADVGPNADQGAAYVYGRNVGGADNWGQVKKLTAPDGAVDDSFGNFVSIGGDTAAVAAVLDDDNGDASGSVYVFGRNAGGLDNWGQVAKLITSDGAPSDQLSAVSISGDTVVAGALGADVGPNANQGAAYVFERNAGGADNWGEVAKFTASDGAADDVFGLVCIDGFTIVVGAYRGDVAANADQGSAYVFRLNQPPAAADDGGSGFITDEDTAFTTGNVLANDSDPDTGDTLSVQSIDTAGTLGIVADNGDGTFAYDPNGQFDSLAVGESAADTFTYTVTDGNGGTDTAAVTITVNGVNDAPSAADDDYPSDFVTDEDTVLVETVISVLDNDGDPDGDALTVSGCDATSAAGAGVAVNPDGTFSYDPSGAAALQALAVGESTTDTFTYTASDGNGGTDTATVTITVNGLNDPPTAADDGGAGFETNEDTGFTTDSVLANDSDPDATDTFSVTSVDTAGTVGLVADNGDGTFNYDPNGQFDALASGESATDTFAYTVTDGSGGTDTATVTITVTGVNDAPTAAADADTTDEDTAFTTGNVLANDSDPDASDVLTVSGIDATGVLGLVADNGDGTFDYDPNGQFDALAVGESTTDTFTYTVGDGNGGTDTATVTITINGVNDAPAAANDADSSDEDTAFTTANMLVNDTDPEDDTLSVAGVDTTGTLGLVADNGDGTFNYDPNGQFESLAVGESADDTFAYTVADGNGGTDIATVTIIVAGVNDAPAAADEADSTDEDTAFTTINVLANDTDPDASDTLAVTGIGTAATLGQVTDNGDGTFGYDPNGQFDALAVGESADDTFTYTVSDGHGGTDTATVTITVNGVNDAPDAVEDDYPSDFVTDEDTVLTETVISVLDNDSDPEGDALTVSGCDATSTLGASVAVSPDGTYTYDPSVSAALQALAVGESTTDTFTYTASDGNGGTDAATVTVTVDGVNDAPTAFDDGGAGFQTDKDTAFTTGSVLANDTDLDGSDALSVAALDATGALGLVTNNGDGTFDYDPNGQFGGLAPGDSATDTFGYTVTDGHGGTDTATVTIAVTGVQEPRGCGGGGCGGPGALAAIFLCALLGKRRR